jgi:hypothetical protein
LRIAGLRLRPYPTLTLEDGWAVIGFAAASVTTVNQNRHTGSWF